MDKKEKVIDYFAKLIIYKLISYYLRHKVLKYETGSIISFN